MRHPRSCLLLGALPGLVRVGVFLADDDIDSALPFLMDVMSGRFLDYSSIPDASRMIFQAGFSR